METTLGNGILFEKKKIQLFKGWTGLMVIQMGRASYKLQQLL